MEERARAVGHVAGTRCRADGGDPSHGVEGGSCRERAYAIRGA
jgi:hypothetical protein